MLRWKRPRPGYWESGPFYIQKRDDEERPGKSYWEAFSMGGQFNLGFGGWYKTLGEAQQACEQTPYGLAQELKWYLKFDGEDEDISIAHFVRRHGDRLVEILEGAF
jgi:hypothetical protein